MGRAADGEEIVIARGGIPVARLVPLAATSKVRGFGMLRGKLSVAKDFDAPLPKKMLDAFYKSPIEPPRRRR